MGGSKNRPYRFVGATYPCGLSANHAIETVRHIVGTHPNAHIRTFRIRTAHVGAVLRTALDTTSARDRMTADPKAEASLRLVVLPMYATI